MSVEALRTELDVRCLQELQWEYASLNDSLFKRTLRTPMIILSESETEYASYIPGTSSIRVQKAFVLQAQWGQVTEVLKHEMAHQYVYENLGRRDETPHGPTFQAVCERLGIDGRGAGLPEATETDSTFSTVRDRIAKLLALAESPNINEAQTAMKTAQKLLLKHNLEMISSRATRGYTFRHLGTPTGRVNEYERILASILSRFFFVEVLWIPVYRQKEMKRGSMLEVCGTLENVQMAEYVHSFLLHTAERLFCDHQRETNTKKRADRRAFLSGVMRGFGDKLLEQKNENSVAGLVWAGDLQLGEYFKKRHPNTHVIRVSQSSLEKKAHDLGREKGRQIVLHKPIQQGPQDAHPRLLKS